MPNDTAPAWPDPDHINDVMDKAGQELLERKPSGDYLQWRRARAEAVISLFAAREAAAWAAGAEAMKNVCLDWSKHVPSDADHRECVAARRYAGLICALPLPPMPGTTQGGAGDA